MTSHSGASTKGQFKGEPLTVYENLLRLCEYRGAHVGTRATPEQFTTAMEANHYVQINATHPSGANIIIIQFSTYRNIDSSSPKFSALLDKLIRAGRDSPAEHNIILVTSAPVSAAIERIIANASAGNIIVEQYVASMFLIVVPEHSCVPRHTIVPRDVVEEMCQRMHMSIANFPAILSSDPVAVWLGIRPGMIVRIDRPSETALIETVYRRCI